MNLIVTMQQRLDQLKAVPTEELMRRLAEKLQVTAETLEELGGIIRILEERKVDLSALKIGIMPLLRKIAYGQLLAGLVAQCSGNSTLLRHVQNLALPDQQKLLMGEKVRLMVLEQSGPTFRLIEPHKLTAREIRQVFADDHIRDDGEQRSYIEDRRQAQLPASDDQVVLNVKRAGATINGKWFSRGELAAILARLG